MDESGVLAAALQKMLGGKVHVELKDGGGVVEGRLAAYDGWMNLVLDGAEAAFDGGGRIRYGRLIIRGSSIRTIRGADGL